MATASAAARAHVIACNSPPDPNGSSVRAASPSEIRVTASYTGEGERWDNTERFALSEDGERLLQLPADGPPLERRRGPAEPKGAPAHSATKN